MRKITLFCALALTYNFVFSQNISENEITVKSNIYQNATATLKVEKFNAATHEGGVIYSADNKSTTKDISLSSLIQPNNSMLKANGCDTVTNLVPATDTTLYTWNFGSYGYFGGTMSYTNKTPKFAEHFTKTGSSTHIQNVELTFTEGYSPSSTKTFKVTVWNDNGPSGAPGTVYDSYNIPYKSIENWIKQFQGAVKVTLSFNNPINISLDPTFFVGIECDTFVPDTLAMAYTKNLFGIPGRSNKVWTNIAGAWNQATIFIEQSTSNPLTLNGFTRVGVTQFPINAKPTPLTDTICQGDIVSYTSLNTTNVSSYQWIFTQGSPGNGTTANMNVLYNTPGVHSYQYRAYNQCGMANAYVGQITVNPKPTAVSTGPTYVCPGGSATLSASGGGTYLWIGGGATGNTNQTVVVTPSTTTNYDVVVTNSFGCKDTASHTVSVPLAVTAGYNYSPSTLCINSVINFTSTSSNAITYQWTIPSSSNPNPTVANPIASWTTPGVYNVKLRASNQCFTDSTTQALTLINCSVGVNEVGKESTVTLSFANQGLLINSNGVNGNFAVRLFDASGKMILNENVFINEGVQSISLATLVAKGIYIVQLQNEEKTFSSKLIK